MVIAIIGLLAAMLLPALQKARLRGKMSVCLSNLRQLSLGVVLYADDSNGWLPQNYMEGGYNCGLPGYPYYYGGYQVWMTYDGGSHSVYSGIGHTWPYVRSRKVYFCPANPRSDPMLKTWDTAFEDQGNGQNCTYFYRCGMYPVEPNPTVSVDIHQIRDIPKKLGSASTANRVMLTDKWHGWQGSPADPNYGTIPHGDGKVVSLAYTDGSARLWNLPGILPLWCNFDAGAYTKASFSDSFYSQLPWWWIVADQAR